MRAAELGYAALAVTDRNSLAGVVRAHAAARQLELRLIVGAEIHPLDAPPVLLWTTDRASYGRLARLITRGRRQAPKGEFRLSLDELAEYADGLLCGVLARGVGREMYTGRGTVPFCSEDCAKSGQSPAIWKRPLKQLARYRELFGDRGYLVGELIKGADDEAALDQLVGWSRRARLPLVAAGDVHYHAARGWVCRTR